MLRWQTMFSPIIEDRGRECAANGAVLDLHRAGTAWEAMVVGTELYRVRIELARGQVNAMSCSCPHANKGARCKHMAAVFAAFEKRARDVLRDDDAALSKRLLALSSDEIDECLQLAIDVNSTRCTAVLLNHKSDGDAPQYLVDEFTLDDLPADALDRRLNDTQGDNDPMKLLFPEEYKGV